MATTASTATVTRVLAAEIAGLGISTVFTLMGEDTAALVTVLGDEHGLDIVTTRHESAAVMGADAYAWATGGVGVCVLGHGPGYVNGLNAAATSAKSGRPVVIVTGHDAHKPGIRPEMKQSDQAVLARALGLEYFLVEVPDDASDAFRAAVVSATGGRPAVVGVRVDVLHRPVEALPAVGAALPESAPAPVLEPSRADVERVADVIAGAKRPLIVAGRGAIHARDDLLLLAERVGAFVGTSLLARDLFRGHRLDVGVVGGWASDPIRPLLDEFDAVIVFGASLNSFTMAFGNLFHDARIVQIDIDESHLGAHYPVHLGVVAESASMTRALLATVTGTAEPELHRAESLARLQLPLYLGEDESADGLVDPRIVATTLAELLPENRTVVSDGGHFMGFPGIYLRCQGPDRFRITSQFASIGLGIGAAMGAARARPGEPVVFFVGDAGMAMTLGDLETVVRHRVPLTIVVMDDGALGAERHFLDLMGESHAYAVFGNVDFAGVARSLGMDAATVRSADDLRALAPELSQTRTTPFLVDCKIRGDLRARWLDEIDP